MMPAVNTQSYELQEKLSSLVKAFKNRDHDTFSTLLAEIQRFDPIHPTALHFEGLFALEVDKNIEKAHALVKEAFEIQPDSPAVAHNLATIKINLGDFAEAERLLLDAIRIKPNYAEAYHTLSAIRKFKVGDPIIEYMEKLATSRKFSVEDASFLCFALAKAYDDLGRYRDAWDILVQGNQQMEENYVSERYIRGLENIKAVFTREKLAAKSRFGHPSQAPIFIVGMPRSGTTLLETILGENPLIRNAGELPALPSLARTTATRYGDSTSTAGHAEMAEKIPEQTLFRWGEAYLAYAQSRLTGWTEYFTDKLPDNSFNIGLAAMLLPNAKFIHIKRDPLDVTLSIYFQRFTSLNYGFKIDTIVEHYKHYRSFMAHWESVIPDDRLISVNYEDLVDDKDNVYREIHARFGLITPYGVAQKKELRTLSTASRWQARQPIYGTSKHKWKRYETQLLATRAAELLDISET